MNLRIIIPESWHAHPLSFEEWMNKIKQEVKRYENG